jgi:hypothetical protein
MSTRALLQESPRQRRSLNHQRYLRAEAPRSSDLIQNILHVAREYFGIRGTYISGFEAPRMSHSVKNIPRVSRVRQHNRQLVSVTMTVTKSTATLTSWSTKSEPSRPEHIANFACKKGTIVSRSREKDSRRNAWDTYALWRQDRAIRSQTFFGHSLQAR